MESMTTILLIEEPTDLARVIRRELEQQGYQPDLVILD